MCKELEITSESKAIEKKNPKLLYKGRISREVLIPVPVISRCLKLNFNFFPKHKPCSGWRFIKPQLEAFQYFQRIYVKEKVLADLFQYSLRFRPCKKTVE